MRLALSNVLYNYCKWLYERYILCVAYGAYIAIVAPDQTNAIMIIS